MTLQGTRYDTKVIRGISVVTQVTPRVTLTVDNCSSTAGQS
jgi:hypothetical protein